MRSFRLLAFLFITLLTLPASAAESPGEIVWLYSDYPPNYILSGPHKGRGVAEKRETLIRKALPEFRHHRIIASMIRIHEEMKHRDNACNGSMQKTKEREQFAVFSDSVLETLPNGLITRASRKPELAPFLNAQGELKLAEFLQSGRFRIAVAAGRSYGAYIDADLKPGQENGSLRPFTAADIFSTGLLQLVNQKSVDAVLGYPTELGWSLHQFKLPEKDFWFVPIAGSPALMPTHVVCSRGATGRIVIERVNEILRQGELQEEALKAYLEWLPPSNRAYYEKLRKNR